MARGRASSQRSAHLLPAYDEYNVAYKDRHAVLDRSGGKSLMTMWEMLGPTISINGKIIGGWKASIEKNSSRIDLYPARVLKNAERLAIANVVDQYARFVGLPEAARLHFSTQTREFQQD